MAARRLTAKERRELPAKAFGIPSQRKYPVMVLGRDGKPKYSLSHARDAKARAKEGLEKGWINKRQYNQIIKKADLAQREARKKAPKKKATRRRNPPALMNPSEGERAHTGDEALAKAEMYWRKYEEQPSRTNFLVDSYKFLVIAHEELKYSDEPDVRLAADHALKRAHAELSRRLRG
jgi:hypothetical protein